VDLWHFTTTVDRSARRFCTSRRIHSARRSGTRSKSARSTRRRSTECCAAPPHAMTLRRSRRGLPPLNATDRGSIVPR
jgi:hypothetical protein